MNSFFFSRAFAVSLEFISFIAALGTFRYHNAVFRLFFFDLLFICILESIGIYISSYNPASKFLYSMPSLFAIVEIPIIYLATLRLIHGHLFQKIVSVGLAGFLFLWIKYAVETKLTVFPTFLMLYSSIFALIVFLAILMRMIGGDNIFKQPLFYFCLGMLIFYGCTIPYFGVINYFNKPNDSTLKKLVQILFISNYFRYSLFAISYVVLYNQQRKKIIQGEVTPGL